MTIWLDGDDVAQCPCPPPCTRCAFNSHAFKAYAFLRELALCHSHQMVMFSFFFSIYLPYRTEICLRSFLFVPFLVCEWVNVGFPFARPTNPKRKHTNNGRRRNQKKNCWNDKIIYFCLSIANANGVPFSRVHNTYCANVRALTTDWSRQMRMRTLDIKAFRRIEQQQRERIIIKKKKQTRKMNAVCV